MTPLHQFSKWLQLKIYQIEVTFSVYMFTPWEKFIFWSVVFLFTSLTTVATILYLPQHIVFILSRVWFYIHGDAVDWIGHSAKQQALAKTVVDTAASVVSKSTISTTGTILKEL